MLIRLSLVSRGYCRLSTRIKDTLYQKEPHLLKVAVIGLPNAGKSTLINQVLDFEVCPVSKRVHTTRQIQSAVYLRDSTQIVFVDTPGVVNKKDVKKFEFSEDFITGTKAAVESADVVGVIHDISNRILRHKLDSRIVKFLGQCSGKDTILILNKVDTVKSKRSLLDAVRFLTNSTVGGQPISVRPRKTFNVLNTHEIMERAKIREANFCAGNKIHSFVEDTEVKSEHENDDGKLDVNGWAGFKDVFMISALTGDGVDLLKDYFLANAKPASWQFNEDVLTDCPPMELAIKILRSKMLEFLPDEIPYSVIPTLDFWEEDEKSETLRIVFGVKCTNARYAKIVIGQGGRNVIPVQQAVENCLTKLLRKTVDIHIKVSVEEARKK